MRRPAELNDPDRRRVAIDFTGTFRPMGVSKRIPSPYIQTQPPVPPKQRAGAWPAALAFLGLCLASAACVIVGAVTIARWAWGLL